MRKINIPEEWKIKDRSYYLRTHDPLTGRATGYSILSGETIFDLHTDSKLINGIGIRNITLSKDSETIYKDELEFVINPLIDNTNEFKLKITGHHEILIDWGDGHKELYETDRLKDVFTVEYTHKYDLKAPETLRIRIIGSAGHVSVSSRNLLSINQLNLTDLQSFDFSGCMNLSKIPDKGPINLTSLDRAFSGCSNLNIAAIEKWDLSKVVSMRETFVLISNVVFNLSDKDLSNLVSMEGCFSHGVNYHVIFKNTTLNRLNNIKGIMDGSNGGIISFDTPLPALRDISNLVNNSRGLKVNHIEFSNNQLSTRSLENLIENSSNCHVNFNKVIFDRLENINSLASTCFGCEVNINDCSSMRDIRVSNLWNSAVDTDNLFRVKISGQITSKFIVEGLASNVNGFSLDLDFGTGKILEPSCLYGALRTCNDTSITLTGVITKDREDYTQWAIDCTDISITLNKFKGGFLCMYENLFENCDNVYLGGNDISFGDVSQINQLIKGVNKLDIDINKISFGDGSLIRDLVIDCDELDSSIVRLTSDDKLVITNLYRNCNIKKFYNTAFIFGGDLSLDHILTNCNFGDGDIPDLSNWVFRAGFNVSTNVGVEDRILKDCSGDSIIIDGWHFTEDNSVNYLFKGIDSFNKISISHWGFEKNLEMKSTFVDSNVEVEMINWFVKGNCTLDNTFGSSKSKVNMSEFSVNGSLSLIRTFSGFLSTLDLSKWNVYGKVDMIETFKHIGSMGPTGEQSINGLHNWRSFNFGTLNRTFADVGNSIEVGGMLHLDLWNVKNATLVDTFEGSTNLSNINWYF